MKKRMCLLLSILLLMTLAACGGNKQEAEAPETEGKTEAPETETPAESGEWTRQGYYSNEDENMLSVTWMDLDYEAGWYVGFMNGEDYIEDSYGGMTEQEGNTLRGTLSSSGSKGDLTVTVSEEGENGLMLVVEGGETYHFTPLDLPEATIFVHVNVDGAGNIDYAEGETAPEIDPQYPFQSAQINLAEPTVHTFVAWPDAGYLFVKWTKNGEDFSTEPQITVTLDESADFVAVFEEDADWQNPVMNFVGEYQCDRAHALVECFGGDEAWITIDWGSSAWELTRWIIVGPLDTETLTITYTDGQMSDLVYNDEGDITSEDVKYTDGTGTIVFNDDGTFTWHDDRSETGEDMLFEWVPVAEGEDAELANPWREITEAEALELCPKSFAVPEGAENVSWSVMDSAADPSGIPGALVQLLFDLDGNNFTAREQVTGGEEIDLSGMYYEWTAQIEEPLRNWGDGMTCSSFRFIGENEYADLCTWYDADAGVSYSVGVAAEDLDGFDLLAVAEALAG